MTAVVLGIAFAGCVALILYGINPPRRSLADTLAQLGTPSIRVTAARTAGSRGSVGWASRLGLYAVPMLQSLGLPAAGLRGDLEIAEVGVERLLAEKAAAFLTGVLAPSLAALLWWALMGSGLDLRTPALGCLVSGAAMFFVPDLHVRAVARKRRQELRHTLSLVLNLVVVALAGGAGIHQALEDATAVPQGWGAAQLRRALTAAEVERRSVWQELGDLGSRTGVRELVELAATVSLAGSEGAKIRSSLEAKAAAMRTRRLAAADGAAQSATERMSLPVVVLFAGFLIFIGYPALQNVLTGL